MNHTSFTVSDLDESIQFYRDILGMELISLAERDVDFSEAVTGIEYAKMNIAYMRKGDAAIELIQYIQAEGVRLDTRTNNIGSTHVCFNVTDFDKWMEWLKGQKVRFRGKVTFVPAGPNKGKKVCYCMDNDGNNLEFIEKC